MCGSQRSTKRITAGAATADKIHCFLQGLLVVSLCGAAFGAHAQVPGRAGESSQISQLRLAIALAEHGEEAQALALTNHLLAQNPDFVPALKLQGELLEDANRQPEAALSYEKALKRAPDDPDLLLKVGIVRLVTGEYDESIALLQHRLKLIPKDRDTLYYLAQAYHLKGENDLALKAIAECTQLDPTNASVLQKYGELLSSSGNNEDAIKKLLAAQKLDSTLPRMDFDLAIASYNNMDFASALKYASESVVQRPNDPEALALYASAQVKLGQWQSAEEAFQQTLALNRSDVSSLLGLGHCQVELKQYPQAIDTLQRVVQIDPTQVLAHFYLSRAYAGLGKSAEAQQEADIHAKMLEQLSVRPASEDVNKEKAVWAQAREFVEKHQDEQARLLFKQSASGPSAASGDSYVLMGALYLSMGQTNNAEHMLHRALEINPAISGAYTYLGIAAMQQGDLANAEQEFDAELKHHPNFLSAIAELGEVRYRQGRWQEAADKLASSETTDPALLYMLCDSYFHLGKQHDAEVTAETLAAYAENEPQVISGLIGLAKHNKDEQLAERLSHSR